MYRRPGCSSGRSDGRSFLSSLSERTAQVVIYSRAVGLKTILMRGVEYKVRGIMKEPGNKKEKKTKTVDVGVGNVYIQVILKWPNYMETEPRIRGWRKSETIGAPASEIRGLDISDSNISTPRRRPQSRT